MAHMVLGEHWSKGEGKGGGGARAGSPPNSLKVDSFLRFNG